MKSGNDDTPSFVVFGGIDWWYHNRAHIDPQLARCFSKVGRTLFVNSIVMQKLNVSQGRVFLKKFSRKVKSILTGLKKIDEEFWIYSPFTLPLHHIKWAKSINDLILQLQIWYVSKKLGLCKPVVLVACPGACDVALGMDRSKLIYQRTDRFEETPGIDVGTIVNYDKKLKRNADLTIYVNRKLFEKESDECKNPFFLDHGVDFDLFASAEKDPTIPGDIAKVPKPIVGYFGTIDRHSVNVSLTEDIAEMLPEMSFVYIGTSGPGFSKLFARKNVYKLGQKPYEQIPHYGKCFDVAILPWNSNRWTQAANPIKIKEYLALGKPFVSTPAYSQIEEYFDVAYIANTSEEFAHLIREALKKDSPDAVAARRRRVKTDTWNSKAELVLKELFGNERDIRLKE